MAMDGICYNCALAERNNQRNKEYWYSGTVKNEIYCSRNREYVDKTQPKCKNFVPVNENKSGCFITTVVVDILGYSDDCYFLNTLRDFRDNILQKNPEYHNLLLTYDAIGPRISKALKEDDNRARISVVVSEYYLIPICRLIKAEDYRGAINAYIGMVRFLQNQICVENTIETYKYDSTVTPAQMGHGRALVVSTEE